MIRFVILLLLLIATQISGYNIFKNISNEKILLTSGKSFQNNTTIGSSKFKSNFQNTFGIQLPIDNELSLGFNLDFFSLIPSNSTSKRQYKVRSISPSITKNTVGKNKLNYFYGLKIPIQIISYKESGTIDINDEELTSFGIEPLIGKSIPLSKIFSLELQLSAYFSYLPKLSHQSETNPEKNKLYFFPKLTSGIIF
tara:strand:+ start:5283 stop:5873 length:591 start_codon:yes stop_codon:yes gene_type:complete